MPALSISGGTSVARTGSTVAWTGLGGFPSPSATSGSYTPGDKSQYARFAISPSAPLSALPPQFQLLVDWTYAPVTSTEIFVIDDTVGIGDSGGLITANGAFNTPLHGIATYNFDTAGLNVSTFNAGGYYLYLGLSSQPSSYSPGAYSFTYSGTGTHDNNGSTSAWSGSPPFAVDTGNGKPLPSYADENGTLVVTASGPGSYVVADITVTGTASGTAPDTDPPVSVCSALASNGYGGSDYTSGHSVQSISLSTTHRERIYLSGGTGSASVTAHARGIASSGSFTSRDTASVSISASAVAPDSVDVTLSLLQLSYVAYGGTPGPVGSAMAGTIAPQDEQEMTTNYLGDTLTFWAQLSQYSTGAAYDATGSVAYRVYEETTDTPILTGTLTSQDDPNTTGFYRGQISVTLGNGFEIGKTYCIRVGATVDSVSQAGIVERFVIREKVATEVWSVSDPGDSAGRAATLSGMIRQVWSYCFNRNSIQGSLQSVYRDDSSTVMLQGTQSASDTTADRGRMA